MHGASKEPARSQLEQLEVLVTGILFVEGKWMPRLYAFHDKLRVVPGIIVIQL